MPYRNNLFKYFSFIILLLLLAEFHSMYFGLVWFGLVWFGLVWFGLVWFGLVWFGFLVFLCIALAILELNL